MVSMGNMYFCFSRKVNPFFTVMAYIIVSTAPLPVSPAGKRRIKITGTIRRQSGCIKTIDDRN
jgi:hypothetical protein